ncbi:hypothetical protein [Candidatus Tisiphia endosymbiont of Parasteatoda lunata]|uniref:hypothetical protein n=1 Tax=Candidatus Tisiphia endosymbiont of Parasteatoda lunata TaxID=3066275 RepID=UPI00313D29CA
MSQHKKNISVKCKILLKNICMIHSYLFLIRYLKSQSFNLCKFIFYFPINHI